MMSDGKNSAGSGSYVLDSMDAAEREDFEAQLSASEDLRNEVTELTDTAVLLGMAVDPVVPSDQLKANIMSKLAATPQLPRDKTPERRLTAVPRRGEQPSSRADMAREPSKALSAEINRRWFNRPMMAIIGAAAAVLLVAGVAVGASVSGEGTTQNQEANALAAINAASDVQHSVASVSTGGTATLVWSLDLGKSALITTGLPALPASKTYELWYIDKSGVIRGAGLFQSTGHRSWQVLDGKMSKGDTVGVTVEPAGGSKQPTTKPIVAVASA